MQDDDIMSKWWKVYFWFAVVLSFVGIPWYYSQIETLNLGAGLSLVSSLITVFGLYSFVFRKKLISKKYWVLFFWFELLHFILFLIPPENLGALKDLLLPKIKDDNVNIASSLATGFVWVFYIVLELPILYALYQLGYNKKIGSK